MWILLLQLFLIVQYPPLIRRMARVLFSNGDSLALDFAPEAELDTPALDSNPDEVSFSCRIFVMLQSLVNATESVRCRIDS